MQLSTMPFALVVEDDPFILMQGTDILEHAGFRCHEAMDGEEALDLLRRHHESVVLLFSDVDLGAGINGFELARHVDEHWPHIEIVIASGHVLPGKGLMPDKATFITKPFDERVVVDHLAKTLPDGKKPEPLKHAI